MRMIGKRTFFLGVVAFSGPFLGATHQINGGVNIPALMRNCLIDCLFKADALQEFYNGYNLPDWSARMRLLTF